MCTCHPESLGESAGPRAEEEPILDATAGAHTGESVRGLDAAEQHSHPDPLRPTDDVRTPVDTVRAVHVEVTGRTEHRPVAVRGASVCVAGRVVRLIRLDLDDDSAHSVDEKQSPDERSSDRMDVHPRKRIVGSRVERSASRDAQKSCCDSAGLAVAASRRRARRPRSARSTRPSSAAAARRSARSSAPSSNAESPAS